MSNYLSPRSNNGVKHPMLVTSEELYAEQWKKYPDETAA